MRDSSAATRSSRAWRSPPRPSQRPGPRRKDQDRRRAAGTADIALPWLTPALLDLSTRASRRRAGEPRNYALDDDRRRLSRTQQDRPLTARLDACGREETNGRYYSQQQ